MTYKPFLLLLFAIIISACEKKEHLSPCELVQFVDNPEPAIQIPISNNNPGPQSIRGMIHTPFGLIIAHTVNPNDSIICLDLTTGKRKWGIEQPRSNGSAPSLDPWNHALIGSTLLIGQGTKIFQIDLTGGHTLDPIIIEGEVSAIYPSDIPGTCIVTGIVHDFQSQMNIYSIYLFDQKQQTLRILLRESSSESFLFGLHHQVRIKTLNHMDTLLCYVALPSHNENPDLIIYNLSTKVKNVIFNMDSSSFGVSDPLDLIISDNLLIIFDQRKLVAFDINNGMERWRHAARSILSRDEYNIYTLCPRFSRINIQDGQLYSTDQSLPDAYNVVGTTAYHLISEWLNFTEKYLYRNTSGCKAMRILHPGKPGGSSHQRYWSKYNCMDQSSEKIYLSDGYDLFIYNLP